MNLVEYAVSAPEALSPSAYTGWIKDYCDWVRPSTDAGVEGMFATASINVGLAAGRTIHIYHGFPHYANLFVVLLGLPGVARKTTLLTRAEAVRTASFNDDAVRTVTGLGSGEGLLEAFCEVTTEGEGKRQKEVLRPRPGRIVLLNVNELTAIMHKTKQQSTANSYEILMDLYDGKDVDTPTRQRSIVVRQPFCNMIAATTPRNLVDNVQPRDLETGFMPRFATFHCTPRAPIASPPEPDWEMCDRLAERLRDISAFAANYGDRTMPTTEAAARIFDPFYAEMETASREAEKVTHILNRIQAQVKKWALIYAIQDCATKVTAEHMERAIIVGRYLARCAVFAYSTLGIHPTSEILNKVRERMAAHPVNSWFTANDIHHFVGGRVPADVLRRELDAAVDLGVLLGEDQIKRGRKIRRYALPGASDSRDTKL